MDNELMVKVDRISLFKTSRLSEPLDSISHNLFNESEKPPISFTTGENSLHDINFTYMHIPFKS